MSGIYIPGLEAPTHYQRAEFGIDADGNAQIIICRDGEEEMDIYDLVPVQDEARMLEAAEWVECKDGWDSFYYECSACRNAICTIEGDPLEIGWDYCPSCGRPMTGIRRIPEEPEEEET